MTPQERYKNRQRKDSRNTPPGADASRAFMQRLKRARRADARRRGETVNRFEGAPLVKGISLSPLMAKMAERTTKNSRRGIREHFRAMRVRKRSIFLWKRQQRQEKAA